ncbi:MAG: hypothetical protein ABIJ96_06205 [Elusimicrobiota bacterium]
MIKSLLLCAVLSPAAAETSLPAPRSVPPGMVRSTATGGVSWKTPLERKRALMMADLLVREGRLAEAESWTSERAAADPQRQEWLLRLARIYAAQMNSAAAVGLYQQLLDSQGEDPGLFISLGQAALAAREPRIARQAFLRARAMTPDPVIPYYLSELEFSAGRTRRGRKWARTALKELGEPRTLPEFHMNLRLRSRFGWKDSINEEFGRLYDKHPREPGILADWTRTLTGQGFPEAAAEPLALLRERFPSEELSWRRLEAERLRRLEEEDALDAHLRVSMLKFPGRPSLLSAMANLERRRENWCCAEEYYTRVREFIDYRQSAEASLRDARWKWHHYSGPFYRWRDSTSARATEVGVAYSGMPWRHIRVEAEASRDALVRRSRATRHQLVGGTVSAAYERPLGTAGLSADYRSGDDLTALSPLIFGRWKPVPAWRFEGEAQLAQAWRNSVSALAAGGKRSMANMSASWNPWGSLRFGGRYRHYRMKVSNGGRSTQNTLEPSAAVNLLNRPVYVGAGYRYVMQNTASDEAFLSLLSISPRSRVHYVTLSAGKYLLDDRLRVDGYVFNGHDDRRGRKFGTDDLIGFGLNLAVYTGRLRWLASYNNSREEESGIVGRSQGFYAAVQWRWKPRAVCREWEHYDDRKR